jgi:hypothetical protein
MNSIPLYRDFGAAGELRRRPRGEPAPARRGLLHRIVDAIERIVDAIERSHQRAAERDIARILGASLGPDGRLTDEIERRLFQHLNGDRGFRP